MVSVANLNQWLQFITGLLTFLAVVLGYLSTRKKVREVHVLVNKNNDDLADRVDQLGQSIQEQGGKIPPVPPRMIP